MENIEIVNIIFSLGKAHAIVLVLIIMSYILEKLTGLNLFVDHYTWKKSALNADMLSSRDSVFYLILNSITFGYDLIQHNIVFNITNLVVWFILIYILTNRFYYFHRKYQAVDPNKADDDFT